jgi:hypothetical protein
MLLASHAARNCMNSMPVGMAARTPMCSPPPPSARQNWIDAVEVVNCVYAVPRHPAITIATRACRNDHNAASPQTNRQPAFTYPDGPARSRRGLRS